MTPQHPCLARSRNGTRTRTAELRVAALMLLATLLSGCSTTSVQSVNHANGMIEIGASAVVEGLTPADALTRATEACRLIGPDLAPTLDRARELPRQGDRKWVRYAFQCAPRARNSVATPAPTKGAS